MIEDSKRSFEAPFGGKTTFIIVDVLRSCVHMSNVARRSSLHDSLLNAYCNPESPSLPLQAIICVVAAAL
jgi:hypothetical protein